ncbi:unnamed protein product [Sphagnum jensenii]|uniref:Uncharacterized protein n=1 Tax=Sphagnum jensenii TaxID=128206 RepID=A0ABP1AFA9_9BRYO
MISDFVIEFHYCCKSLSSQRTHYQQQQQQQQQLSSFEKAEYKRQHDLSSHGQLWSCQRKTTNMQFELQ